MKTLLLSLAILLFTAMSIHAQKNSEDVVYLKNGSVIRGTITELMPDSIVKIEIMGGSLLVFKASEIKLISRNERKTGEKAKSGIHFYPGYRIMIDGGFLFATSDNNRKSPFSTHFINYIHFTRTTALGLGVGLEFFDITQMPFIGELRQYINRQTYAPFLFVQGGYLVPIGTTQQLYGYTYKGKDGFMINPGFGFLFPLSDKTELSISLSYRYQELNSKITDYYKPEYVQIEKMNRLNFRLGIILH